jgi:hypothetical protein
LVPLDTLSDLSALLVKWDGAYPDPEQWGRAQDAAVRKAAAEVRRLRNLGSEREVAALRRQLEACRQRLIKELGRYLICIEGSTTDLNAVFHQQMSRDIAGARRLQLCCERLGGYPEWGPDLCRDLESFFAERSEGQQAARLLGSELDAALSDPRWVVKL